MIKIVFGCAAATVVLAGCASMPNDQTVECMQPNRRVEIEVGGSKIKPPPKPKPGEAPGKPGRDNVLSKALIQGSGAWDYGAAELKPGGKAELDKLVKSLNEGAGLDKRSTDVGSIIIVGHTDRYEAEHADPKLGDMRARTVAQYLTSKGQNSKLMFWENKGAKMPVPVTKFCES